MRFWTSESQTLVNFCAHCSFSIRDLDHGKVVERSCFKQFLFFFRATAKAVYPTATATAAAATTTPTEQRAKYLSRRSQNSRFRVFKGQLKPD